MVAGPAAAEGAVQADPGGDLFALQRQQRGLGRQRQAAGVLGLDDAGRAEPGAFFGAAEEAAQTFGGGAGVGLAALAGVEPQQRFLDLAHRRAQLQRVAGAGVVVAGAGGVSLRLQAATVEDRQRQVRPEAPGDGVRGAAAGADQPDAEVAVDGQLRPARRVGHAHLGGAGLQVALGRREVGPLRQRRRGQRGQRERGRFWQPGRARGEPFAQHRFVRPGQQHQRLDGQAALGLLHGDAVAGLRRRGLSQPGVGGRFEPDVGFFLHQRAAAAERVCLAGVERHRRFAGAQCDVGLRHVGGQRDTRLVPAEFRLFGARPGRLDVVAHTAEQVDLPAGVDDGAGLGDGGEVGGGGRAALGLQVGADGGPATGRRHALAGARLLDAGQRLGEQRVGGLRFVDQRGQQRVVELRPPGGELARLAGVGEGCLPGRGGDGGRGLERRRCAAATEQTQRREGGGQKTE